MADSRPSNPEGFPTTRWSKVARAASGASEEDRQALADLLRRYLPALRAYLVRTRRIPGDRADDLLQAFVTQRILEKNLVARADRERGRLRTFLLTALANFVAGEFRREAAGRTMPVDPHELAERPVGTPRESSDFDLEWARQVLAETMRRTRAECEKKGRPEVWTLLECRVVTPTIEGTPPLAYPETVRRFGFQTPREAANMLVTGKRMLRRNLRAVIGEYADADAINDEIRDLWNILSHSRAEPPAGRRILL